MTHTTEGNHMTDLIERAKAALESGGPVCLSCGAPRSNHPYRHPFRPSHTSTLDGMAGDLARALIREREVAGKLAEAAREARNIANLAFGAGIEECEGGSGRRQGKLVDDYERRIDAINNALAAYRKATKGD